MASQPKPFMGVLYFASFVVLANMMILNLFIGVITTSMAEAKQTLEEEMVVEEQERQRQKRILLGLPSESEAEDGGLDDAIGVTIDRIQYLLRKCETKSSKFETTFKAVVRELDMPNSSSRREQILYAPPHCIVCGLSTHLVPTGSTCQGSFSVRASHRCQARSQCAESPCSWQWNPSRASCASPHPTQCVDGCSVSEHNGEHGWCGRVRCGHHRHASCVLGLQQR